MFGSNIGAVTEMFDVSCIPNESIAPFMIQGNCSSIKAAWSIASVALTCEVVRSTSEWGVRVVDWIACIYCYYMGLLYTYLLRHYLRQRLSSE